MSSPTGTRQSALGNSLGFTLMELLVVTVILGTVTAVIAACFAGGLRALASAKRVNRVEASAGFGLLQWERDLLGTTPSDAIPFEGGMEGLTFPTLLPREGTDADGNPVPGRVLGTVRYAFDPVARVLRRKAWVYPRDEPLESGEAFLAGVSEVRFFYFCSSEGTATGERDAAGWQGLWMDPSNAPGAVRIDLAFTNGAQRVEIARTVTLAEAMP